MDFTPKEVLALFDDTSKVIRPQINHYAFAELAPGARIRAVMKSGIQYYLATAENQRRLFGEYYLGAILAVRDRYADENNLQIYQVFIHADAVAFCDKLGGNMITPISTYWADLFYFGDNEAQLKQHFSENFKCNDAASFEDKWKLFVAAMKELRIVSGQIF